MLNANDLQLLSDYLDDALIADERAALEARLQTDAELSRELARLRATVELIGTLPTLTAPRSFALTPGMARRRSTILTSAAFSTLSAAAAVVLLVIGAALFTIRTPAPSAALDQIAFAPSAQSATAVDLRDTNSPVQPGSAALPTYPVTATAARELSGAGAPPAVGNAIPATALKAATEPLADGLFMAVPTDTLVPPAAPLLYAAPSAAQSEVDTSVPAEAFGGAAESQADAAAQATQEAQQRLQNNQQAAPAQNGVAAEAPLPAPTQAPSEMPSATPTSEPTETLKALPSPTAMPTLASATPTVVNASQDVNTVGIGLIVAALVLFVAAIVTTLLRRRG